MKAVEATFNQEKALVGAFFFFVITNIRMELFEALVCTTGPVTGTCRLDSEKSDV